jgi:prepilin-type N-terminal cleavage/methylation domain-containing protein
MNCPGMNLRGRAFTLTELLVVIAIIAILEMHEPCYVLALV